MGVQASGMILPPGSLPRIRLEQREELTVKILGYGNFEAWVEYPDGQRRHHQASDVITLLQKIEGQLRMRYNIDAFAFKKVPQTISTDETITIGDITYG